MGRTNKGGEAFYYRQTPSAGVHTRRGHIAQIGGAYSHGVDGMAGLETGLGGYLERITVMRNGYPAATRQVLNEVGQDMLATVKALTPVNKNPHASTRGKLRRGWGLEDKGYSGSSFGIELYNQVYYCRFVEDGHSNKGGSYTPGVHMLQTTINYFSATVLPGIGSEVLARAASRI
mgnify:CR=1 FL=1